MSETAGDISYLVGLVGVILVLILWAKSGFSRLGLPPLLGYLGLGFLMSLADQQTGRLPGSSRAVFAFLAQIGLVVLLFQVGLESRLDLLRKQLKQAGLVWMGDVVVSGLVGFAVAFFLAGLGLVTSLVVGTALTATSVGISVAVWEEKKALGSGDGSLLVDVAELDDISAVVLMALLFSVLPVLETGGKGSLWSMAGSTAAFFAFKLALFGVFCFLFSRFLEEPLTRYFRRLEKGPDPMLSLVGLGLIIAALTGMIGFSLAIGGFFAGLLFSRDPQAVKMETSFLPLYDFFSPFFFIGVGLSIDPAQLGRAGLLGMMLLGAAVLGKLGGDMGPLILMRGWRSGVLIGLSMLPRAEITMAVMQQGQSLGRDVVPPPVYAGMVLVSAATSVAAPVSVRYLLDRWSGKPKKGAG